MRLGLFGGGFGVELDNGAFANAYFLGAKLEVCAKPAGADRPGRPDPFPFPPSPTPSIPCQAALRLTRLLPTHA